MNNNKNQRTGLICSTNTWFKSKATKVSALSGVFLCVFGLIALPTLAEDEVFLATLDQDRVLEVINISNREGYDNQPHFTPDSTALLFSAMYAVPKTDKVDSMQTDVMRYDIKSAQVSNISNSSASEYSPTITPDGLHYSIIRVGKDAKQLLWQYPYGPVDENRQQQKSLIPNIYDVGYHVWLNSEELLLFVLGDPMTLQHVNINTEKMRLVDTKIGRTLRKLPEQNIFSYTKEVNQQSQLKLYNPKIKSVETSVFLPKGSMYYAWHNNGKLLSGDASKVMIANINSENKKWVMWQDFSDVCAGTITRMVMAKNSKYFAFVCQTPDEKSE